ncbi:MAG: IPTL-CTERM sorting domain-containing protein [Methyloprofundus sp.]|nr:IPTL-CTERM sorting domain-containing protein [Methyloprofundus sp.]
MHLTKLKWMLSTAGGLLFLLFINSAHAALISGGDAASKEAADSVVDIVFAIDTSGSLQPGANNISDSINDAISTMQCPDIDVWVDARLVGIRGVWGATLFNERAETVLTNVGAATTINHSEDNAPVVFDFAAANDSYYVNDTELGQSYAKAIVTIGDEGLDNGVPVNQADYDAGKRANDLAIANNLLVFSFYDARFYGDQKISAAPFQAISEGGMTLGGHHFNPTGGAFITIIENTSFNEVLQQILCQAAKPLLSHVKVVSVVSTNDIDIDSSSFSQAPESITVDGEETRIEWRFHRISVDQIEDLDYEIVLKNPKPGETRRVTHRLELTYTDIDGNLIQRELGEQSVQVLESAFTATISTDKNTYLANENVAVNTRVANLSDFDDLVDIHVAIYDATDTLVTQLGIFTAENIATQAEKSFSSFAFNTGTLLTGDYTARISLTDSNHQLSMAEQPFSIAASANAMPIAALALSVDKAIYHRSEQLNISTLVRNVTINALINGAMLKIKVLNPNGAEHTALEKTLGDLLAASRRDLNSTLMLSAVDTGEYSVVAELFDQSKVLLATAQTQFLVADPIDLSITGTVEVTQASVMAGDFQECINTIQNKEGVSRENIVFRQVLTNFEHGTNTLFAEHASAVIASGAQYQYHSIINTAILEQGEYRCLLQFQSADNWKTLAFQAFNVEDLPVEPELAPKAIPSLSEWGIILLMLALAISGARQEKRKLKIK